MCRSLILSALLLTLLAQAQPTQNHEQIDSIYENAVTLLQQDRIFEANAGFEKIIVLDPYHRDALYNLAIISEKLNDTPSAIRFLLRGVKIDDKRAARRLVSRFKYKLSYADTTQKINLSTQEKYSVLKAQTASSVSDLAHKIIAATPDKKEQLQLLLLWVHDNMSPDAHRFFRGGNPLPNSVAFSRRTGLCDEYSNIMVEFCTIANIPNYKVAGYVKYPAFTPGDTFTAVNHAWNAVYLDSSWLLCDLFWATAVLTAENSATPNFIKSLETNYFLGRPEDLIHDHLPADPVFQFADYPISIIAFTKNFNGIDTTIPKMNYLNYTDSLKLLSRMAENDRAIRIARHGYDYNKNNPDDLVTTNYNYAVDIVNNRNASKQELIKARKSLIQALVVAVDSKNDEIRRLAESCNHGITLIDKRLARK